MFTGLYFKMVFSLESYYFICANIYEDRREYLFYSLKTCSLLDTLSLSNNEIYR